MKRKKISIWILHGSSGVTFELTWMKLAAGLCAVIACLGGALFAVRKSVVDARVSAAASASILEQYLTQRMSANEAREAAQNADITPPKISSESERLVDAKIKLLAEEFVRVRSYEKQLQSRASVLDSVLDSILNLDDSFIDRKEGLADENLEGILPEATHLGIGGGDTPVSTLFSQYSSIRKRSSRAPAAGPRTTLEHFDSHIDRLNMIPLGAPVIGVRTSGFGARYSPFTGKYHQHGGLDIAVDRESSVLATADGVVIHAGAKGAYGEMVIIDHGNQMRTLYAHLSRAVVKKGQRVCRGQQLGLVGSSGRSTGPHLHYEVRFKGVPKNPEPFVQLAGLLRAFGIK